MLTTKAQNNFEIVISFESVPITLKIYMPRINSSD